VGAREDISYLIGTKVGEIVVLEEAPNPLKGRRARRLLRCLCYCGKEFVTPLHLVKGKRPTKSCGCARGDSASERFSKLGLPKGYSRNCDRSLPEFVVWQGMINRCYSDTNKAYEYYKGKGIKVCDRWIEPYGEGFKNFMTDMGSRPEGYVLDRKNSEDNYGPNNCRWVTPSFNTFSIVKRKNSTSSGKIGVTWLKANKKWRVSITCRGVKYDLGCFVDLEDAIAARRAGELKHFGMILGG
jgi:hypothetical protein